MRDEVDPAGRIRQYFRDRSGCRTIPSTCVDQAGPPPIAGHRPLQRKTAAQHRRPGLCEAERALDQSPSIREKCVESAAVNGPFSILASNISILRISRSRYADQMRLGGLRSITLDRSSRGAVRPAGPAADGGFDAGALRAIRTGGAGAHARRSRACRGPSADGSLYRRLDDHADRAARSICQGCQPDRLVGVSHRRLVALAQQPENLVGDPAQAPDY